MRQFTKTVRLAISPQMQDQLRTLKRLNINPTKFMRIAIQKELDKVDRRNGMRYDYVQSYSSLNIGRI